MDLKNVIQIIDLEEEELGDYEYDFNRPESVIMRVFDRDGYKYPGSSWKKFYLEDVHVMRSEEFSGAASYESENGFLDYTIEGMCDEPEEEGYYVVEGITATFDKGDGWMTDDDMDFYYEKIRKATPEEIKEWIEE
jgi:hypothetical protein